LGVGFVPCFISFVTMGPTGVLAERARFQSDGRFVPAVADTYDIGITGGGANPRWRSLFCQFLNGEGDRALRVANQTNQAAAQAGTLGNAPVAGNPAFWIPVVVNGVNRSIPCW
jgi:hypothetical protein